jgi:transcriptional regulator with XRE-family HTH domain
MDGRKRVAWNLRRLRVERGLSQERLAVDAEVDTSYVSQIENEVYNPTVGVLDKLASALKVDVGELLRCPPANEAPPASLRRGKKQA